MSDITTKTIIVKQDPSQAYHLWSNFENFPAFMKHIKAVHKVSPEVSHWVMDGPLGKDLEWNAQITDQQENKRIAWKSLDGDIKTSGAVTFSPLGNGETQITVSIHYVPPAGKLGQAAAHLFDNPDKKLEEDLRRFKQYAESSSPSHAAS
jgi:uncharacterized membrane protein